MENWFGQLNHWHWWVLAVILLIVEVLAPAFFFLWLGLAAGLTGFILWLFPSLDWEKQVLFFSLVSVVSVGVWQLWFKKYPTQTQQPVLNQRGRHYIGRTIQLEAAILNGIGRIRVDDTQWTIHGPDLPAGEWVQIIDIQGINLVVRHTPPHKMPK